MMTLKEKLQYGMPDDVKAVLGVYSPQSKFFSLAFIKVRYDRMDRASQIRAEKTMLALSDGRNWDAKSGS